jgi:anti-sigma B factor antagonist
MIPPYLSSPFRADPPDDGCLLVRVSGELDLATSPRLAYELERIPDRVSAVVLDLAGVGFMDCSALPALLKLRARFGRSLQVCRAGSAVTLLLRATGLSGNFVLCHVAGPGPVAGGEGDGAAFEVAVHVGAHLEAGTGPTVGTPGATAVTDQAVGLLMGTHRCDSEQARRRLRTVADAHGVVTVELAGALTAAAARREDFRCSAAVLSALVAVMRPDRAAGSDGSGPAPEDDSVMALRPPGHAAVARIVRQRSR